MPTYRAYMLDDAGKITWGDWIEAASLEEAEALARDMCEAGAPAVELWQGAQRIGQIDCASDPEPEV